MSVKIEYICDTCRDKKPKSELLAVMFYSGTEFRLISHTEIGFNEHRGVHVCQGCLHGYKVG